MRKGFNRYLENLKAKFDQVTNKITNKQQSHSGSYSDSIPREEILFSQYPLQKYGKNLKKQEFRIFRIEKDKLLQSGSNNIDKQLPTPTNIYFQCSDPQQDQNIDKKAQENQNNPWSETMKDFKYRLYLKFQDRQPVWIYFKTKVAAMQIATKITAIRDRAKFNFNRAYKKFVDVQRNTFIIQLLKKTKSGKQSKSKITRGLLTYGVLTKLSDEEMIKQLIQAMYMKVMKQSKNYTFTILFKTIYTFREDLGQAQIKFWIGGEVGYKGKLQSSGKRYGNNIKEYKFIQPNSILFQDIDSRSTISIELISPNIRYRCDRFNVQDLRKKGAISSLGLMFKSAQKKLILSIDCQFQNLDSESYHKQNPIPKFQITPQYYPLINQIFYHNISIPIQLPPQLSYMHKHHKSMNKRLVKQPKLYQPHQFARIFQSRNIQQLINKFFLSYPFNQYIMVENRGSFVYEYITAKSEKIKYWDIEQIIWQIGSKTGAIPLGLRRLLNALKCFDENPRIIFTQNLGYLCIRILSMCNNLSQQKWPHGSFKQFSIGSEAMAFFIILSLLQMYNGIFIRHGLDKRTIQNDSILFHYVLKTVMNKHYTVLMSTQINFQALFGQQYVNLFSRILPQGLFQNILEISVADFVENGNKQKQYNYIFIATFLTIIEFTCNFESPFISGQHYLIFLEYYFNNLSMPDHLHFMSVLMSKIQLIKQCSLNSVFLQLRDNMKQFYSEELMLGGNILGEVGLQLYDIFSSYKYKNASDLRKLYIILDKIQLGNDFQQTINSNSLLLYLYQGKQKIYSHTFQKPNLSQLRHSIEINLKNLQQITVLMQIVNNSTTFSFKFSPLIIPSNYYLQDVQPLKISTKVIHENRYVCYQIFIKDNCQVEFLDHRIPQKYVRIFHLPPVVATQSLDQTKLTRSQLLQASLKQDASFCSSFAKAFRMSENNFCVLYGKLGWYGCHYILPQQRLLDIQVPLRKHELHGYSNSLNFSSESAILKNALQIMRYCRLVYGKAIIPYPIRQRNKLYTNFLKNNIVTQYNPHNDDAPIFYDSVNSLTTYVLQNFRFSNQENFLQFYRKFIKLPLIKYLTYQPSTFMPMIQFDFWWQEKKTKVILTGSIKGKRMKSNYTNEQIARMSRDFYHSKIALPLQLEFIYPYFQPHLNQRHRIGFCDHFMTLDNLFTVLKWNIIDQALTISRVSRSLQKSTSDAFRYRIRIDRPKFPNVYPSELFICLVETKQTLELTLQLLTHHARNNENLKYFVCFGHINGKWRKVAILCRLKGEKLSYYYVQEWQTRTKHILNNVDIIVDEQFYINNRGQAIPQLKFTDEELQKNKQHVGLQLSAFI